jgi:carbon dioxide concentrating mechanism protein CcmN
MPQDRTSCQTPSIYVAGDVTLADGIAIAPGVVLQAAPDSQLVVEARVCIGAGAVIQAYGGQLSIGAGTSLGPGVLVLGAGSIGENACVGSDSTLINPQLAANGALPARSLQGDPSRLLNGAAAQSDERFGQPKKGDGSTAEIPAGPAASAASKPAPAAPSEGDPGAGATLATHTVVYGREQVTQLIQTLFPHRRPLTSSDSDGGS